MQLSALLALASLAACDTTTVNLGSCAGTPQLFGQGVLYGMSANNPPQSYISDLKINYESAGGAQTNAQPAGYASSLTSYQQRFQATVAAFRRIRQNNGIMIVKMADLWGADFTQSSSLPYPGDNGDWSRYDAFVQQVINDLRANGMASASYIVQVEPWNEPDINFGNRPQSQFNAMFVRGTRALRAAFPSGGSSFLPIVGPSTAGRPQQGNGWWNSFLSYLQGNGGQSVQPDVWNWHLEAAAPDNNDPIPPAQYLPGLVRGYGLTTGIGLQNNEYGARPQQVPSYSNWFKARYERLKFNGLRGNWAGGSALNDLLAQLLIKSGSTYSTTGEYQAYKYYADMTGSPCTTTAGSKVDSYATASNNDATALVGSQFYTGSVSVAFQSVSSRFGSATSLRAQVYNIPYNNGGAVSGPTLFTTQTVSVSGNTATVTWNAANGNDGWAVRLTT
ncbi:MAG: hypothetical protein Q9162_007730 [Coniocarpon cinnabarinum]